MTTCAGILRLTFASAAARLFPSLSLSLAPYTCAIVSTVKHLIRSPSCRASIVVAPLAT